MAEHLAAIFGTKDYVNRVNCPFYFKIGACRHGDHCVNLHTRPIISRTLLFSKMYYQCPEINSQSRHTNPHMIQDHVEEFYEDIFEELSKFGEIEILNICDNLAPHLMGNVYVQFREEEQAAAALRALQGEFYTSHPIVVEFSPVTDFHLATCWQFAENNCNNGVYCNFMHVKQIGRELRHRLFRRFRRARQSRSPGLSDYGKRDEHYCGDYRLGGGTRSEDMHERYDMNGGSRYDSDGEGQLNRYHESPLRRASSL